MSLSDDALLCNFPKCRGKLGGFAWVTACSHAFCDQHGSREFSRSPAVCPACSSTLSRKMDIVRTELSPSEDYKAMVLAGLRPDIVLDISTRALAFWSYQVHQERMYQEYSLSRVEVQLKQLEKLLTQHNQRREMELSAMRGEITSLKKVMEEYKRKYGEVSERLMERSRQYQKLQGMYDALRLRNMVVIEQENLVPPGHHQFNKVCPTSFDLLACHSGVPQHVSTQRSPQFLCQSQDGESRFFGLDGDESKAHFPFNSSAKDRACRFKRH